MTVRHALLVGALALAAVHSVPLHSSQVCSSPWSSFTVKSGDATVAGQQGATGISKLEIRVFKKTFTLTGSQLKELAGFSANGLRIYSEGGYAETGGETYYIVFYIEKFGQKSSSKTVSVSENGSLKIINGLFQ